MRVVKPEIGGTFIPASAESYKGKLRDLLEWYRRQMKVMDVEVHLNDEVIIKNIAVNSDNLIDYIGTSGKVRDMRIWLKQLTINQESMLGG